MKSFIKIQTVIFIVLLSLNAWSQEVDDADTTKKIVVVKEYQPIINDATKINIEPDIKDTVTIKPLLFKYYFVEYPIFVDFEPQKINAATMQGEPLYPLYSHYLNVGIGSQPSPFRFMPDLEYFFNSDRNKNFVYGAHAKLFHASGNMKLANGNKVPAPVTDEKLELFGKRIMRSSDITSTAYFTRNVYTFYGVPDFMDTVPSKSSIYQRVARAGFNNRWFSTKKDTTQIAYDINLDYDYANDKFSHSFQNSLNFGVTGSKYIKRQNLGFSAKGSYFNQNLQSDTANVLLLNFKPFISVVGKIWRISVGIDMAVYNDFKKDSNALYNFYPQVLLQYNIIENFMIPYFGVDGGLKVYDYSTVLNENPYVRPNIRVQNENNIFTLFGGMKGNFTRNFFYDFNVRYSIIDNMHFYVNDTTAPLYNMFDVVYDNVELLRFHGEITWKKSHKFNLFLRGDYNKYNLQTLDKPWQKPEIFIAFTPQYQIRDKIYVNADFYYVDKMYALIKKDNVWQQRLITPTYELNLGVEYMWSRNFSAYFKLYNLLGKYEMWNYYSTFGTHFRLGVTYLL